MNRKTKGIFFLLPIFFGAACSKKKSDDMGSVQVSMANGTSTSLQLSTTPTGSTGTTTNGDNTYPTYQATTYGIKLVQIYLNEDVAADGWTNSGTNAYIWINPICGTTTSDSGAITMANNGTCDTSKITSYFELARSSEAVNADLNSQQIPIPAQTYRYIRVQLCDNSITDDNVQIASTTGGLASANTVRSSACVLTPVKIDPPLTVAKDESVKISLTYDLSKALVDYNYNTTTGTYNSDSNSNESCAVADDGQGVRCVSDITYTPSVSK